MARPKKRLILIGTQAVVILGLILGLIGFVGNNKTVAVTIDGQEQEVTTFAGDVRGVLEAGEIDVAAGDEISPSLDESISDGDVISIARMKEIQLEIDGETETYTTTAATLSEFLATLNLDDDVKIGADLNAELVSFSTPIEVRTPQELTVTKYGEEKKFSTTATTLEAALAENDLKLGSTHKLFRVVESDGKETTKTLQPSVAPADGMELVIEVHSTNNRTEEVEIPFETKRTNDNTLNRGTEKVKTKGQTGVKTVTYQQKLIDGEVVEETKTDESVTKEPVDAEIRVGTKQAPQQSTSSNNSSSNNSSSSSSSNSGSSSSSSNSNPAPNNTNVGGAWQALAQCESGGNWSINTGNGYYGGLQFSASSWAAAGGTQYAPLPHQATPAQQIATAERLKQNGGWGHWPACSSRLGLR